MTRAELLASLTANDHPLAFVKFLLLGGVIYWIGYALGWRARGKEDSDD